MNALLVGQLKQRKTWIADQWCARIGNQCHIQTAEDLFNDFFRIMVFIVLMQCFGFAFDAMSLEQPLAVPGVLTGN